MKDTGSDEDAQSMVVAAWRWRAKIARPAAIQSATEDRPDLRRSQWHFTAIVRDASLEGWEVELGFSEDGVLGELTIRPAVPVSTLPAQTLDLAYDAAPPTVGPIPPGGITRRLLKDKVAVGAMIKAVRAERASDNLSRGPGFQLPPSIKASWAEVFRNDPRPGRRGRDDAFYAVLAAQYVEQLGSRTPIEDLARELHLSAKTVRSLVSEARRRELLTRTPRGVAGGELTAKALALLESED